jgi:hypothetical protein
MNLQENIRRILREESRILPSVLRRVPIIDEEINRLMREVYGPDKVCIYRSGEELLMVVTEAVVENMYWQNVFGIEDDTSIGWEKVHDSIVGYIQRKYGKKLEEHYYINCGN